MEILSLGEKIKRIRKEQNMTLKDLAGDKVTPGQISLVESGKSKPSIDLLEYISEKMNVSIDYILETEEHQAEKYCSYYAKIAYASLLAKDYSRVQDAIDKIFAYAKDYKLEYYKGIYELYSGIIEYDHENYGHAQERLIAAVEILIKESKVQEVVEAYIYLGLASFKLGYFNSALNYFKKAEKTISDNDIVDDEQQMKIYFNISLCYSRLGYDEDSINYALLAAEKYDKRGDRFHYGQTLLMMSLSYSSMGKQDEALMYADKAIHVFKEMHDLEFTAKMETNIGMILANIGNIEDSFKHLKNAYRIELDTHDKSLPYTMLRMADNYIKMNDIDKAMEMVKEAYEYLDDEGQYEQRVAIYYYFYRLYLLKQDNKNAELSLLEAVKYLQNLDMPKQLADIYIMLGEFYEKIGNSSEALRYYNKGISLYKDLGITSTKDLLA